MAVYQVWFNYEGDGADRGRTPITALGSMKTGVVQLIAGLKSITK